MLCCVAGRPVEVRFVGDGGILDLLVSSCDGKLDHCSSLQKYTKKKVNFEII